MHVTEVDITFVKPKDGLVAFASVVLDDQIFLSGIAIHQKLVGSGHRSDLPDPEGRGHTVHLFHPIRKPIGLVIKEAILEKLKDVMSKHDAGHDRFDVGPAAV
jgi:DNA-binding cell septation regulator SpoVG